ncbi:transcription-repair coupling factor [Marinithermus hydrothermalis]|uniref:Transcription-repair-coupling factor n=1 Tax=Marinithermus hydrothermalis (strain DSM 14884 / JCM 11576 / T1) TaxID=869210 RepID=F2NQP1_MARHT|nr:transcription-repair coupling factor [Marinithermus hydrothermalis]AEB11979.1 transcription-repair coupling factor [Marinithermus hydrothermalis DSM 14884]
MDPNPVLHRVLDRYVPSLPQVARAYLWANLPAPAVLIAPQERLKHYQDLAAFGRTVYVNPGLEAVGEVGHYLFSFEAALRPFPKDPDAWRIVLEVGRTYLRDALLDRLERLGYGRDGDYRVLGEVLEVGEARLEFFGDVLERVLVRGKPQARYVLPARPGKAEAWDSVVVAHFPGPVLLDWPALAPPELWPALEGRNLIAFGRGGPELPAVHLPFEPLSPYRAQLSRFARDVRAWLGEGRQVVFFYRHERSRDYLIERHFQDVPHRIQNAVRSFDGLLFVPGAFEGGFVHREEGRVYVTEELLYSFSGAARLRGRRLVGREVADPDALSEGDYLIHPEHGIGRFLGIETREVLGVKRDYLVLQYAGDGRLYLPIEQLSLLRRHPGTTDDPPRLSRLGKNEWARAKAKAQKDAEALAQRLLVLHAKREATPGYAFTPLPDWDPLIEKNFPYTLTPDQKRALEETLKDLETPRPMDRLISGDVGFGKTEVALRAAHRVVGHGKQVAFLVPTTLLAQQHYETFCARFRDLPVSIGMLSRFTSAREERRVLEGLKRGAVDIVIGTHRLLSADVAFRDLGLLIIDEEHRFGVAQKERLKELREGVDVLTLSATPIPRTLYQALVGLKDVSSIQTPPPGRKPIRTILAPFDPALVREAVMFEIERGGKAFYVHDRVASIAQRAKYLEALIPEARIGVVHGQMPEDEIEEVMFLFQEGAFDLLVATTIVESGLDIPEANTILIERADKLGLANLYQLRGRVGRREKEAYAYLFHPPKLTEAAERRLAAIADLSDLGSGHLLAEKDMEIRGVGNLLGPEQHGHIRAVSFEVYTELLAEAVRKLKGEAATPQKRVTLDLAVSARLVPEYIPDAAARSRYYGKFAELQSLAELARLVRELKARYGPPPREVEHFFALTRLRLLAEKKGVLSITEDLTHIQVVMGRWPLDYDARGLRSFPQRVEVTQHPPGFRVEKKGLEPGQYPQVLMDLLYLVG